MAKLPRKNTFASETADSFGGIDCTDSVGSLSNAYDMANIRILPDGSLTRREGSKILANIPYPIRCAISCPSDPNYIFVLADEVLYSVNISTGVQRQLASGFNKFAPAFFFKLDGLAYMFCDGIYGLHPTETLTIEGYIPLVGRNWGVDGGEIFEHPNMLSFQIRIDYLLDRESKVLFTGFDMSAIDAVYVNGTAVTGAYIDRQYVQLPAVFPAGTRILLCLTLGMSIVFDNILTLLSCTNAYSCNSTNNSAAILYGGDAPNRLFLLKNASEEQVAESQIYYPDSANLYCPTELIIVKDLVGGIRAVCGEPDCLLVMGEYEIRRLTPDGEMPILGIGGCTSDTSMAYFDGIAYIASANGIRKLPLRSGSGEIISDPIKELLSVNWTNEVILYYDSFRGELLVKESASNTQSLFIYDPVRKLWCRFFDIRALGFFDTPLRKSVGFWTTYKLMGFVDGQDYDLQSDGSRTPIAVYFTTRWTDLGQPHRKKRLRRMQMVYTGFGEVEAIVSDKSGEVCRHTFKSNSNSGLNFCNDDVRSSRTDQLQVMLFSNDQHALRIHQFGLSAIK